VRWVAHQHECWRPRPVCLRTYCSGHSCHACRPPPSPSFLSTLTPPPPPRPQETKYLSQGENTRTGQDVSDLKEFTLTATAPPFSISAKPGQERPTGASEPRLWRLQCFRSKGVLADGAHMRLYFLQQPEFPAGWRDAVARRSTALAELADPRCLSNTDPGA
jgi:hypothetical protein